MPTTVKRHFLKEKEIEEILQELSRKLNIEKERLPWSKPRIEIAETQSTELFMINGKPILARFDSILSPTLISNKILTYLPKIIVDMGAIPYICNGADVMAPGIVRIEGDFNEDDILLIVDERYEKPLAIGFALLDSQHMRKLTHGKVAKNVHYVGDNLWNLLGKM